MEWKEILITMAIAAGVGLLSIVLFMAITSYYAPSCTLEILTNGNGLCRVR